MADVNRRGRGDHIVALNHDTAESIRVDASEVEPMCRKVRIPGRPLENGGYEAVALALSYGKSPTEACRLAGVLNPADRSFAANARRLCRLPDIRAREIELRQENRNTKTTAET